MIMSQLKGYAAHFCDPRYKCEEDLHNPDSDKCFACGAFQPGTLMKGCRALGSLLADKPMTATNTSVNQLRQTINEWPTPDKEPCSCNRRLKAAEDNLNEIVDDMIKKLEAGLE